MVFRGSFEAFWGGFGGTPLSYPSHLSTWGVPFAAISAPSASKERRARTIHDYAVKISMFGSQIG